MATNECNSVVGRFDGHMNSLKQYTQHCPVQHVQGYTGSHWRPPSGDYLLRIAPAAARATTANETMTKIYTYIAGHFYGHGNAPARYHVHHPMEEVQGFTRSH
jgi:hypothetical protein